MGKEEVPGAAGGRYVQEASSGPDEGCEREAGLPVPGRSVSPVRGMGKERTGHWQDREHLSVLAFCFPGGNGKPGKLESSNGGECWYELHPEREGAVTWCLLPGFR